MAQTAATEDRLGIGGNQPPPDTANRLIEDYAPLEAETKALLDKARELPTVIEDEATYEQLTRTVKDLRAKQARADEYREIEKKPHLLAGRAIDFHFGDIVTRLKTGREILEKRASAYLAAKAAAERKRRDEELAAQRAEADRLAEEARKLEQANKPKEAEKTLHKAVLAERVADLTEGNAAATTSQDLSRTRSSTGTSSLTTSWDFQTLDLDAIPFEKIKHYFTPADVEKAIRGFIKAKAPKCDDQAPEELAILPGVRIFKNRKANIR